jgi:hypothetical protein
VDHRAELDPVTGAGRLDYELSVAQVFELGRWADRAGSLDVRRGPAGAIDDRYAPRGAASAQSCLLPDDAHERVLTAVGRVAKGEPALISIPSIDRG